MVSASRRPVGTHDVDRARPRPLAHRSARSSAGPSDGDRLEELRTAYLNERFAPEILPHRTELIEEIQRLIDTQVV